MKNPDFCHGLSLALLHLSSHWDFSDVCLIQPKAGNLDDWLSRSLRLVNGLAEALDFCSLGTFITSKKIYSSGAKRTQQANLQRVSEP